MYPVLYFGYLVRFPLLLHSWKQVLEINFS